MATTCHLLQTGSGVQMKRFSTLLLSGLCVALSGVAAFTVFAVTTGTLTASNRVIVTASDQVFYAMQMDVNFHRSGHLLAQDQINHSGMGDYNLTKTTMEIKEAITFTKSDREIRYTLKIQNYSEFEIMVTVSPAESQYLVQTVTPASAQTIAPFEIGKDAPSITFEVVTGLKSVENSFVFQNQIEVGLEKFEPSTN